MLFPSGEWAQAWVDTCNADEQFIVSGEGWCGAVACVVRADEQWQLETQHLRLDGQDGHWNDYAIGPDAGLTLDTLFVLTAGYSTWKALIRQELNPIRAMVQGRVRVSGQLSAVLRWSRQIVIMTQLAGRVDTTFPDELR